MTETTRTNQPFDSLDRGVPWWSGAVGYSLYIRSFADSDGDGVGDLPGIIDRLDYLRYLGVDLVWITPFYPSPMADGGYDVANYCEVDPVFGDLADFDQLVEEAHKRGIRLILDLVPNHSSIEHPWFREATADPESRFRDYYIWADPSPAGGPPNNWVSYFGGPAWSPDQASGQYYLHLFLPEQPDLNWRNQGVRDEFEQILRFWLERGVDGFRVDVAQGLVKNVELRSNPEIMVWDPSSPRQVQWDAFDHRYDILQPESSHVFADWKAICLEYDAVLVGEASVGNETEFARLVQADGLDIGLWLQTLHCDWSKHSLEGALVGLTEQVHNPGSIGWLSSSLDEVRAASRFGGGAVGQRRGLGLTTLLFCLPGVPFLYLGEELGLEDGDVGPAQRVDPVGDDVTMSRDGCRTPMPWSPGLAFGFSSNIDTWLPHGGRADGETVSAQRGNHSSWLERYRSLIRLRHELPDLGSSVVWLDLGEESLLGFRRGLITVVLNMGETTILVDLEGLVLFRTGDEPESAIPAILLRADEALVLQHGPAVPTN